MKPDFYPCEMLTLSEAAVSIRAPVAVIKAWIKEGRFPPPVEIEGEPLVKGKAIPKEEVSYIAALITAGRSWDDIERAVARLVKARQKRIEQCRPGHLDATDVADIEGDA